jgi:ABC-2 type transport system permease protein
MSLIDVPAAPRTATSRLRWTLTDALLIARRNLSHIRRTPEKLLDVTVQPIIFVLLFGYVFGSAVSLPGNASYIDYLMPGIFVLTMVGTFGATAVGFAADMTHGVVDRFRSLPIADASILLGRTLADITEILLGLCVLTICGLVAGWRPHQDVFSTAAAFGLLLLLAFAMNWVGVFVGLSVRAPEAVTTIGTLILFPLMFLSNTFVPTQGMAPWLRTLAEWNPVSATVAAIRQLLGDANVAPRVDAWPLQYPIIASVGWSVLLLVIFVPLAIRQYRRAATR